MYVRRKNTYRARFRNYAKCRGIFVGIFRILYCRKNAVSLRVDYGLIECVTILYYTIYILLFIVQVCIICLCTRCRVE